MKILSFFFGSPEKWRKCPCTSISLWYSVRSMDDNCPRIARILTNHGNHNSRTFAKVHFLEQGVKTPCC